MVISSLPESTFPDDRFRYGWRTISKRQPDGSITYEDIPLAAKAFLDPQEGDHLIQGTRHYRCAMDLFQRLALRYDQDPTTGVFGDLKMCWGISGLPEPAPDVAIVPHLQDKARDRQSFDVRQEGTRPCLVIEVMSPNYPADETDKVDIYRRAGIAEYLIVKPYGKDFSTHYSLRGYRLLGNRYQIIPPDSRGFLHSQTAGVDFGVQRDHQGLILRDHVTGESLLSLGEQAAVTKQQMEQQKQRADQQTQRAEALAAKLRALGIDPDN